MTNSLKKATNQLITSIQTQIALKQRLIELAQEAHEKMENGIMPSERLEMEFDQLSHELNRCVSQQLQAEISLGMNKSIKFVLN
jgi:hypothetical protein